MPQWPAQGVGRTVEICPISGRSLQAGPSSPHHRWVPDPELRKRVAASTGLSEPAADRVIDDVLAYYREAVEDYVRRRHTELQLYGTRNAEAFQRIGGELRARLVAAPELTERQLRRIVYG
jgi:hypothetical protein